MIAGQGNFMVPIALFGWIPLVSWLFAKVNPRLAAAIAFAAAWMFLPVASIPFSGLPDFTKVTATCVGILLASWAFDRERLLRFRFMVVDIPMLLWCTVPFLSSVANGLGAYDGISESMYQSFTWGLPYVVGRIYFTDLKRNQYPGSYCLYWWPCLYPVLSGRNDYEPPAPSPDLRLSSTLFHAIHARWWFSANGLYGTWADGSHVDGICFNGRVMAGPCRDSS